LRGRGNCEHAAPTWTGTKPSPTPSLRPPKPSTSSNPRLSHEQVAPVHTCQERPVGPTPSSGRKVLSANRTLTRRARPPTGADQVRGPPLIITCDWLLVVVPPPHRVTPAPLRVRGNTRHRRRRGSGYRRA